MATKERHTYYEEHRCFVCNKKLGKEYDEVFASIEVGGLVCCDECDNNSEEH